MPKHISDSQGSSTDPDRSLTDVESSSFLVFSPEQGTSSSSRELREERQRVGEDSDSGLLSLRYRPELLALPGLAVSHGEVQAISALPVAHSNLLFTAAVLMSSKLSPSPSSLE
jgi:hypothetical protein